MALYRKYRSETFAELVGQDHIVATLLNQVRLNTVAHAYLFAGVRGTGKTSTARVLARAVNCLSQRDGEPCNTCQACRDIVSGASVDVLEIDAASNRGIDEMRDLREKVKYLPASLTRKVYIIDEAHMLTNEAWNAFLKTLEEPPAHVLFILATTEPHRIPDTVRSRVQRFDFRRVPAQTITDHLTSIVQREGALADSDGLSLISAAAQGSVRDALSLLEQALALGAERLDAAAIRQALGWADPAMLYELLRAISGADTAAALRTVTTICDSGADVRHVLREAARLARDIELCAVGYPQGMGFAAQDVELFSELARIAPTGFWLQAMEEFNAAETALRQPVDARLQLELCILRLTRSQNGGHSGGKSGPSMDTSSSPPQHVSHKGDVGANDAVTELVGQPTLPPIKGRQPETVPDDSCSPSTLSRAGISLQDWEDRWSLLVEAVNRRDAMLAGVLRDCQPIDARNGELTIGAPYAFHLERIKDVIKTSVLTDALVEVAGASWTVTAVFAGKGQSERVEPQLSADQATQAVLDTFPGSRIVASRARLPG